MGSEELCSLLKSRVGWAKISFDSISFNLKKIYAPGLNRVAIVTMDAFHGLQIWGISWLVILRLIFGSEEANSHENYRNLTNYSHTDFHLLISNIQNEIGVRYMLPKMFHCNILTSEEIMRKACQQYFTDTFTCTSDLPLNLKYSLSLDFTP